jgi:hypothetical protein
MMMGLVGVIIVTGCDQSADQKVQQQQEGMQQQAVAQVGLPGITNYTELKLVRKLYELRDQNIATYSYIPDMNGKLWHLCDSIGYGVPYATQFSNPMKEANWGTNVTIPQAEPNGLFMPANAEGTWVTCIDPTQKGNIAPLYVEPRVIVSPFKLRAAGEYAAQ